MASHAIIVDAGSSGTRLYIYKWTSPTEIVQLEKMEVKLKGPKGKVQGIHELVSADQVEKYLGPLFESARTYCTNARIDAKSTPLFLLATAGVRDLASDARKTLLECLTDYTQKNSGFAMQECRAITGTEEALFGWVAANLSLSNFPSSAIGYVEMGGASAQIAIPLFTREASVKAAEVVEKLKADDTTVEEVNVGSQKLSVFLGSYRLGSNEAHKEYKKLLFTSKDPKFNVTDNENHFYDPSKRKGYEVGEDGKTIEGKPNIGLANTTAESVRKTLDPKALIRRPLDDVVRGLDFAGGGNFWYSTRTVFGTVGGEPRATPFSFKEYYDEVRDSSKLKFDEFRPEKRNEDWMKEVLDNSLFTAIWIQRVLHGSFGIMTGQADLDAKKLSFTPHSGPKGAELSWTRGKLFLFAVLEKEKEGARAQK